MVNEESVEATTAEAPVKAKRSRRATAKVTSPSASVEAVTATVQELAEAAPAAEAPVKKAPVRRSRAKKIEAEPSLLDGLIDATVQAPAVEVAAPAVEVVAVAAPAKKAPRRRATAPVTAPQASAPVASPLASTAAESVAQESVAQEALGELELAAASEVPAAQAPAKAAQAPAKKAAVRRRAVKKTEPATEADSVEAAVVQAPAQLAGEEAVSEAKTTRSRRKPAVKVAPAQAPAETPVETPVEAPAAHAAAPTEEEAAPSATESLFLSPSAGMSALFLAPDLSVVVPATVAAHADGDADVHDATDADESADGRRGRGRNRNRRSSSTASESGDAIANAAHGEDGEDSDDDGVTSRRRRRRRRGEADLELSGGTDEDPPNTVTKVRAPRTPGETSTSSDRVTSLRGSTRLEAKKQRRRDSRDSGRRRTVITEAEFLARRESVDRVMVVRQNDERIQIGVLEDGILAEHFVSKTQQDSLIGNVYLGKVQNVLPSMEAAFVDIGRGRNAVLYAGEVDWDGANLNGQPRRIENALKSGDTVLVQVSKDPVGHKGARLTSQISLPGRYLVFVPGGSMTGISRKLPDVERNRLKRVLKDHLPENAGVIVRTAAEGASEEELTNDINRLRAQWEGINTRATGHKTPAPEMLYGEPDLTIKVVRDVFNEDFTKLIVSGEEAWDTIEAYVTYVAPDLLDRLEKWSKPDDIFAAHRIDEQISKALERKVFLPSGGSLVIDRTEAMTVVDVNTGKFTGTGGNLEETVTKNNLEAAEEVVRQLRLRDIGGIIVIDFIDMVLESNRDLVLRRMVECLGRDRTKHQVAEVTSLGLVQMTRKRMGTGLLEVFGEQCEACAGRGMVTHEIPVEHRRVHTVAAESHQAHVAQQAHVVKSEGRDGERMANRSTRSERKRNRNRSQPGHDGEQDMATEAEQTHVPHVPVVDEAAEAQKAHKATEARAALANIAAAAAAAHHDAEPAPAQPLTASVVDTATLTLAGEAIELPRGHHHDTATDTDHAEQLAELAVALDQLSESHGGAPDQAHADNRQRSRRGRRNRSARSAQGGADMKVETSDGATAGHGPAQHSSAAAVVPTPAVASKKDAAPIIMLGVGVPASEL
ncbi:ribonuclease E [Arthrobacter alpinus]|uniref:Ribonuclease E n=1 Tax=Arthrobacter alpinus TaxID=656366 RepID=A0A0M4QSU2_9MICC|nr:Rne/Rng family ribonuclease [Arthrobacter alpinus]ALE94091.1 ribonuclease E [Arthrobacter alpinus]